MKRQPGQTPKLSALSAEDREFLDRFVQEVRQKIQIPPYLPPTEEDLSRQRALFEETLWLRQRTQVPGISVDEMLRELREGDSL